MTDLERLTAALSNRYLIGRPLGAGGMATVYLATDLKHDREVALKVLRPELGAVLGSERFLAEIKITARLDHPHILTLIDSGAEGGFLYYVLPLVRGESLRDKLNRDKQLPLEVALTITRQIAGALDYAHRKGVIHRDIKPENILLLEGEAMLADFGIALAVKEAGGNRLTESGLSLGTPQYMSPEQATGDRQLDARSDLYSLAAVLYEMLAGEPPVTGPTAQAMIAKLMTERPTRLRVVRNSVPENVDAAVARALDKTPADRFASTMEFMAAMDGGTSVPATAVRSGAAVPTPVRRRITPALWMLVLGFALGLGLLFAWRQGHSAKAVTPDGMVVAVLPFQNLGAADDEYFADGVTDAVRGKLTALPGLEVIASNSSGQYRNTTKTPRQIGEELGAQYLIVGKVRWSKGSTPSASRVQVSPELIQVATGTTKWQQPFDAALTDVFQVQGDIAGRVASALDLALDAGERAQLAEKPTTNLEAYDLYLKADATGFGRGRGDPASLRTAIALYERAVGLDPDFVKAWAQLSRNCAFLYANSVPSKALAVRAREAADRAVKLGPDQPEGYLALSTYYSSIPRDREHTLENLTRAQQLAPHNPDVLRDLAVAEEDLGRTEEGLAHLREALRFDPRSRTVLTTLGRTLLNHHRGAEAESVLVRAQALSPDDPQLAQRRIMLRLAAADLPGARRLMSEAQANIDRRQLLIYLVTYNDMFWVLEPADQDIILQTRPGDFDGDAGTWAQVFADIYAQRGDKAKERIYADSARQGFAAQLKEAPDDGQLHALMGLTLSHLGQPAEAIREGELGARLLPPSRSVNFGVYVQEVLARIYARCGQPEKAVDMLELLLTEPNYISPGWLRLDPNFAPLKGNPRFERLRMATGS
jgi:serine/threonine-protein kinase